MVPAGFVARCQDGLRERAGSPPWLTSVGTSAVLRSSLQLSSGVIAGSNVLAGSLQPPRITSPSGGAPVPVLSVQQTRARNCMITRGVLPRPSRRGHATDRSPLAQPAAALRRTHQRAVVRECRGSGSRTVERLGQQADRLDKVGPAAAVLVDQDREVSVDVDRRFGDGAALCDVDLFEVHAPRAPPTHRCARPVPARAPARSTHARRAALSGSVSEG